MPLDLFILSVWCLFRSFFHVSFPVHGLTFFHRFPPFSLPSCYLPATIYLSTYLSFLSVICLVHFLLTLSRPRPVILLSLPSTLCPYVYLAPPPFLTSLSIPTSPSPFTQPPDTPPVVWPCGSGKTLISVYRELECTLQGFRLRSDAFV